MVLVDIENMFSGAFFCSAQVTVLRSVVEGAVDLPDDVQVVVAASSMEGLFQAGWGWSGARAVWRPGKDGADLALADVALHESIASRFARVVICSGDGLFAVVARYLLLRGVAVCVVAIPGSLSQSLRRVVADVHLIPAPVIGRVA